MKDGKIRLMGLWKNQDKQGQTYLSGNLGGAKLLVFPNGYKKGDKEPDYIAYIVASEPKEKPAREDDDIAF